MKLLFSGDIAFNEIDQLPDGVFQPLSPLISLAGKADAAIVSFDSAIGVPAPDPRGRTLIACPTQYIDYLKGIPNLILNLANNHAFDCGEEQFQISRRLLQDYNIGCFGAGVNRQDAYQEVSLSDSSGSLAIIGCATANCSPPQFAGVDRPGPARFDLEYITARAAELRKTHDFAILCVHWGKELIELPLPQELDIGRKLLEAFDLVVGNHPHVVRGRIRNHGRQCYFALGNNLFGDIRNQAGQVIYRQAPLNQVGILLKVEAQRGFPLKVAPISIRSDGSQMQIDQAAKGERELERLSKAFSLSPQAYLSKYNVEEFLFRTWKYRFDFRYKAYGLLGSVDYLVKRRFR